VAINAETETVSRMNFKLGRWLDHALSTALVNLRPCEVVLLYVGWGIPCQPYPRRSHKLLSSEMWLLLMCICHVLAPTVVCVL